MVCVDDKFGVFGAAFKMTIPGSHNWSRHGAKPTGAGQIEAVELMRDAESSEDRQKSRQRTQLDRAHAYARCQIEDDELVHAFR